jgi:hypothetical protein
MLSKHNSHKRNTWIYNSKITFKNNFQKDKYYADIKCIDRINLNRESYKKKNKILKYNSELDNSELKENFLHLEDSNVIDSYLNVNHISFKEK